jgi:hypothetical protein
LSCGSFGGVGDGLDVGFGGGDVVAGAVDGVTVGRPDPVDDCEEDADVVVEAADEAVEAPDEAVDVDPDVDPDPDPAADDGCPGTTGSEPVPPPAVGATGAVVGPVPVPDAGAPGCGREAVGVRGTGEELVAGSAGAPGYVPVIAAAVPVTASAARPPAAASRSLRRRRAAAAAVAVALMLSPRNASR